MKLIIWDFDGVTADTEKYWLAIELEELNKYCGLAWDFATINKYLSGQGLSMQQKVLAELGIYPPAEMWEEIGRRSWQRILDGFIELPFALPTAVAGITLSKMYSDTGILGKPLAAIGIKVSYTHLGIIVALIFIGIPFVVRNVQPVLEKLDGQYEEAAYILGASPAKTFFKVILPELRPAILTGFGLAFARGIGEYGSVIYISGNSAKEHTQIVSYVIMQKLSYIDYASATAIALVMLVISFLLLFAINVIQMKQAKRTNNI